MSSNKYVAHDCIVYMAAVQDTNWLANASVDPTSFDIPGGSIALVKSLNLETSLEEIDLTGIGQFNESIGDGKADVRVSLSRLIPINDISTNVNAKSVPKDTSITLTFHPAATFREGVPQGTTYNFTGLAKNVELRFNMQNVRVDGIGDDMIYKRPTRISSRARISSLIPISYSPAGDDVNYNFLAQFMNAMNRVVTAELTIPVSGGSLVYSFTGGFIRGNLNIENPVVQDLELVPIGGGIGLTYSGTPSFYDQLSNIIFVNASGLYTNLAMAIKIVIPGFTSGLNTGKSHTLIGTLGVEELTITVSESDVTASVNGLLYQPYSIVSVVA